MPVGIIEAVIIARLVYRKRSEILAGIENTCEHSLQDDRDDKEDTDDAEN